MKSFKSLIFALLMLVSFVAEAQYYCKVSSNSDNNNGHCRALSSGNGDMCFTFGSGSACSGSGGSVEIQEAFN